MRSPRKICRSRWKPDYEVIPGVLWGAPSWVPSPAFWWKLAQDPSSSEDYVVGSPCPLSYELAFCLLGGYGITAEMATAAWSALKVCGFLEPEALPSPSAIEQVLREPLEIQSRYIRYRFPNQKAHRLAYALQHIQLYPPPTETTQTFREALLKIPGIGPKTASWIARNWLGSDDVAILDIHVMRAGKIMGLFSEDVVLARDYSNLETRFLQFADALDVRPALLDALIWREMRQMKAHNLGRD